MAKRGSMRAFRVGGSGTAMADHMTYDTSGRRFREFAQARAREVVGKPIPPKYQKDYGGHKRYTRDDALKYGQKVAGTRFWAKYGKRVGSQIVRRERRR